METADGGCKESAWGEIDLIFEVVRGWELEIAWKWGFCPPSDGYGAYTFVIAPGWKRLAGGIKRVHGVRLIQYLRW
jgi:hypothetical protein